MSKSECSMCHAEGPTTGYFMFAPTCEMCAKVLKDILDHMEDNASPVSCFSRAEEKAIMEQAQKRIAEWNKDHPRDPIPVRKHAHEVFGTDLWMSDEDADEELRRTNKAYRARRGRL